VEHSSVRTLCLGGRTGCASARIARISLCKWCAKPIQNKGYIRSYCSNECKWNHLRALNAKYDTCRDCGELFITNSRTTYKWLCLRCRDRERRRFDTLGI
jgi:hypothetical protein